MSYEDMVKLTEDRKAQNSIKDNMENYQKLLFLGKPPLLQARSVRHLPLPLSTLVCLDVQGNPKALKALKAET